MMPSDEQDEKLTEGYAKMFACDTARICRASGRIFLILGTRRNTKGGLGQWYRNGKPIDFDYVAECVVANGRTETELLASARKYKRLGGTAPARQPEPGKEPTE